MNSPLVNIFRAAFIADAHCLGTHWVYNQGKIQRLYPDGIKAFADPLASYHPKRRQGQFTHYGDQMIIVAKAMATTGRWSPSVFRALWQEKMSNYDGYLDGATKTTLENLSAQKEEAASTSDDMAGASRFVPTFLTTGLSLEDQIAAAREQTAATHNDGATIESAEFFARALSALVEGLALPEALTKAAAAPYQHLSAQKDLERASAALAEDDFFKQASEFGLTCHLAEAFPATLYFALRWHKKGANLTEDDFLEALSENALAGGDNSARAIPLAAMLAAAGCQIPLSLWQKIDEVDDLSALETLLIPATQISQKVTFIGANGDQLDARLELPATPPRGYALFAHCFTCGKSSRAANEIARALASNGFATLRFDFTGLGNSDGDFANTSFKSNVQDLVAAADYLRTEFAAPSLLVGHSLGGAAVLAAAEELPEVTHVATLGAPHDPAHVTELFGDSLPEIKAKGQAEVNLAGRKFQIGERFLNDLTGYNQDQRIAKLTQNLLIMHAPNDDIVGIENAGKIYSSAKHPKSFISLPGANHLLTDRAQARYVASLIAVWRSGQMQ